MMKKIDIKVEVFFTPANIDELLMRDRNVVVIDVLRSSTTIVTALNNGAREIIPVASIESAAKVSGSLFGDVTLRGGERNGKMIEGFNLGNSPTEYTAETVKGKSIIFSTTNGSLAITKGKHAKHLVVTGFVNVTKSAEYIASLRGDFYILCASKQNSFCIEDTVCAGMVIDKVQQLLKQNFIMGDAANAALLLYKTYSKSILKMMQQSEHGKYLKELGFEDDINLCADVDSIPVLPVLHGNMIVLKKEEGNG
ncbi:MAG: 2-phosphosulfolactate phosphatase [Bacteroidetes bacterium]|nr:2-phosphosulfolactate phosphatase [Bacteroidota bacterium]MBU2637057.1 2-phosphosulfolactate phosphatase [Bacteroidota bacterium]